MYKCRNNALSCTPVNPYVCVKGAYLYRSMYACIILRHDWQLLYHACRVTPVDVIQAISQPSLIPLGLTGIGRKQQWPWLALKDADGLFVVVVFSASRGNCACTLGAGEIGPNYACIMLDACTPILLPRYDSHTVSETRKQLELQQV